jgi:L-amino acid N-acyltransferase YncA/DNA-binding transcriptional ArsR family regulator
MVTCRKYGRSLTRPSTHIDTRLVTTSTAAVPSPPEREAAAYAEWFACLAEPMRVRLLHTVATAREPVPVGQLAQALGVSQSTCSHHLNKLAAVGFVRLRKDGTTTLVTVNPACCTGLPHAADAVMGMLAARPAAPVEVPDDVLVRPLADGDWAAVRRIYAEGIATGQATFETQVPPRQALTAKWLPAHRWVAEIGGQVAGWAAATPVSTRECYAGVAETSVYVDGAHRGRGVGRALMRQQVTAADSGGIWTLQTSIFPENRASLALHHSAGYRTLCVRERIARHHGRWRDTVFLERRSAAGTD